MKQKIIYGLIICIFLMGIGLLAYPFISNIYYEYQQDKLSEYYDHSVKKNISDNDKNEEFQECWDYNKSLLRGSVMLTDPFDEKQLDASSMPYAGLLNNSGDGSMGYIQIPAIDVKLMIYHGTGEDVLSKGVGHLQGSSLPVGGQGSHCVLSAHTGLNDKKLFTDLDQLVEGDVFYLHILDEVLAYKVDQIKIVLPDMTDDLKINAMEDYCTLVTCTPYGINTHRLLVRGTRISYDEAAAIEKNTTSRMSTWTYEYVQALIVGIAFVITFMIVLFGLKFIKKGKIHLKKKHG